MHGAGARDAVFLGSGVVLDPAAARVAARLEAVPVVLEAELLEERSALRLRVARVRANAFEAL